MVQLAPASAVPCAMVALTVFGAPTWACLFCFTSYSERLLVCQTFAGMEGPDLKKCEEAFTAAFKHLQDTEISEKSPPHPPGHWGGVQGETSEVGRDPGRRRQQTGRQRWGTDTQRERSIETGRGCRDSKRQRHRRDTEEQIQAQKEGD